MREKRNVIDVSVVGRVHRLAKEGLKEAENKRQRRLGG